MKLDNKIFEILSENEGLEVDGIRNELKNYKTYIGVKRLSCCLQNMIIGGRLKRDGIPQRYSLNRRGI